MKNFHPKTYSYVHLATKPDGVGGYDLYVDGLKRAPLVILDLWADQTNIYTEGYPTNPELPELPLAFIPNGNYTGEEKIIHVVGQKDNPTWPCGGLRLSAFIGESLYFDAGQAGTPGEAGMTEYPYNSVTIMRGTILFLRWFTDRWIITSTSRTARDFLNSGANGPSVFG